MQGLGFTGGNLDRAAALRIDDAWTAAKLVEPATRVIVFHGDRPAINIGGGELNVQRYARSQFAAGVMEGPAVLLGLDDNEAALFAIKMEADESSESESGEVKFIDLRSLALQGALPAGELGILAQARSLLFWHERHGFCANCGDATVMAEAGYRRHCDSCGADHFPRTDPVVIIVVTHQNRCLLGRGPGFAEGVYSALAGFMEPGETLEDAARREVYEESGIRIGNVDYILSQPWPFPSSLMIGLIGEALNDDIVIDPVEIEDARWFDAAELRSMLADDHQDGLRTPPVMAIAHHLVIETLARITEI